MDDSCEDMLASLGEDLQLEVLKVLQEDADKESMQAVLQTSRDMRLRASSLIHKLVVYHVYGLDWFPIHAAITSLELRLRLSHVVEWLSTPAVAGRLLLVTRAKLQLVEHNDTEADDIQALLASVVDALAHACPNLRSLVASSLYIPIVSSSFFEALRDHLPNLTQLEICDDDYTAHYHEGRAFDNAGIEWAACLPAGLTKLHLNSVKLHHALLQHLVSMPSLVDVRAWSLSVGNDDLQTPVQSDACAWRKLQLSENFPDFRDVCRFTTWPSNVELIGSHFHWNFDPPSAAQTDAVATAAHRLSTCNLSSSCTFNLSWKDAPDVATIADIISALAPLAGGIPALCLEYCPITAALLDELALSLPHTHTLIFEDGCAIYSDAWVRLLTLTFVTTIYFNSKINLGKALALATSVPRGMSLSFGCYGGFYPAEAPPRVQRLLRREPEAWDRFKAFLAKRRTAAGLPPVLIHVPPRPEDEDLYEGVAEDSD